MLSFPQPKSPRAHAENSIDSRSTLLSYRREAEAQREEGTEDPTDRQDWAWSPHHLRADPDCLL